MKANAPKRKVFQDAVDLISLPEEMVRLVVNGNAMIPVAKIIPFHNHPFRLYGAECLDYMVESIREHGVLNPVIVQKTADGYEKVLCRGKRNDILKEIARLSGVDVLDSCGRDVHRSKSKDSIGEDYGMAGRNIARYMRLNQTTEQIKKMVDAGTMAMVTAVELSYLSEEEQKQVCAVMNEHDVRIKNAQAVELRKGAGILTADKVKNLLVGEVKEKPVSDAKLFAQIKKKYFKGKTTDEIMDVLEQALTPWFARGGTDVWHKMV